MAEPTFDDIEALVGPATPHFALPDPGTGAGADRRPAPRRPGAHASARRRSACSTTSATPRRRPRTTSPRSRGTRSAGTSCRPRRRWPGPFRARGVTHATAGLMGRSVLVTGGSRGIGKAIALRFARDGATRVAIGYMRSDAAAEETAEELRALGAEPVLVRGNVTSERVLEQVAALGPIDVLVHNAATGVIRPALETEDKHWDWTLNANARAFLALTRVTAPRDAGRLVGRRDLEPRLDPGARELRARRHLEGGARVARALSRGRARAGAGSASTRSRAASSTPARSTTSRTGRRCSRWGLAMRPGASSRRRTSPARSRSSAPRTQRWCAARR